MNAKLYLTSGNPHRHCYSVLSVLCTCSYSFSLISAAEITEAHNSIHGSLLGFSLPIPLLPGQNENGCVNVIKCPVTPGSTVVFDYRIQCPTWAPTVGILVLFGDLEEWRRRQNTTDFMSLRDATQSVVLFDLPVSFLFFPTKSFKIIRLPTNVNLSVWKTICVVRYSYFA